mgnify:CR=1 FL=1
MSEQEPSEPGRGDVSRLFQIHEADLEDMERTIPKLASLIAVAGKLDNRARVQLRRLKEIVSNVRWDYGPPTEVVQIPD